MVRFSLEAQAIRQRRVVRLGSDASCRRRPGEASAALRARSVNAYAYSQEALLLAVHRGQLTGVCGRIDAEHLTQMPGINVQWLASGARSLVFYAGVSSQPGACSRI